MKRLMTTRTILGAIVAILAALIFIGDRLDVWGFPLPASKASVQTLSLEVAENRQVIWSRAKRSDNRDLWELEQRCRANGGCTPDQAAQKRRLMEDIEEAESKLEQIKKERK